MAFYETEDEQARRYERETYDHKRDNQLGDGAICCGWCYSWHEVPAMRQHVLVCEKRPAGLRQAQR